MKSLVLNFTPDGIMECLHTEALPLSAFGALAIRRASTIEFDEATQVWEVRWPDSSTAVYRSALRSECLAWEADQINARLTGDHCNAPRHE